MSHLCPRCAHKYRDCRCGSPDNRDMPCGVCGKTHEPRPCPLPAEPKPAPVVAGERYAVLTEDSGDAHFQDINDGSAGYPRDAQRAIGTHAQAVAHHAKWGGEVVRILADGEHEAAVEAAYKRGLEDGKAGKPWQSA